MTLIVIVIGILAVAGASGYISFKFGERSGKNKAGVRGVLSEEIQRLIDDSDKLRKFRDGLDEFLELGEKE